MIYSKNSAHNAQIQESMRGILILFVIMDHNDIIRDISSVNAWFMTMTFHVSGFFLLPFINKTPTFNFNYIRDRFVRYIFPFFIAAAVYSMLYAGIVKSHQDFFEFISAYLVAASIATIPAIKYSTGFIVLWFLPALFSTALVISLTNSGRPKLRWIVIFLSLLTHATLGGVPTWLKVNFPWGIPLAFYMMPLGVASRYLIGWRPIKNAPRTTAFIATIIFISSWSCLTSIGIQIELPTLKLPTLADPLRFLLSDAVIISSFVLLFVISPTASRIVALASLGRYSLVVYLVHPLVNKPVLGMIMKLTDKLHPSALEDAIEYWFLALLSLTIVTAISLAIAMVVAKTPLLRQTLTPRDWPDWIGTRVFARLCQ